MNARRVVASWSGGIDSTGVIANLLYHGWEVHAVTLEFGPQHYLAREREARAKLLPELQKLGSSSRALTLTTREANWLWEFSPDGKEIPRRNKHIMDHLLMKEALPRGIKNLAMGEYIGADTWVVTDHVPARDCDHRALSAYLYLEYGMEYRLISLQDFGESRYKSDRLALGWQRLGLAIRHTTNCMADRLTHCGKCYKCIERSVAFDVLHLEDTTAYLEDPRDHPLRERYRKQMER